LTQNGQQKIFGLKNLIQDLITTAKMMNHAPTTNGYKPSAPPSTLIKSHGTGDEAKEVVLICKQCYDFAKSLDFTICTDFP
jgi:hypothetical protein